MPAPPSHVRAERAHSAAAAAHEALGPVLTSRARPAVLLKKAWLAGVAEIPAQLGGQWAAGRGGRESGA